MKKTNKIIYFLSLIPILTAATCRFEVPIKELATAKSTLTRAVEVKAEKYAPEEFKKAKEHILESHKYVKEEDSDNAKKEAVSANTEANDAITKSLPPLANDTLKEAKTAYEEAVTVFAEKYAPEELNLSKENITAAESLIDELKFWESYKKSKDAIMYANSAKEKALTNIPALQEWIEKINNETNTLEANRGNEFASEEIGQIRTSLEEASAFLEEKKVKDSYPRVIKSDEILKEAVIKVKKGIAADQIRVADESLKKAEESQHKDIFAKEIEEAAGLISISKEQFDNKEYEESSSKSLAAIELLNSLFIEMEKREEEERIDTEELVIEDGTREYTVQLNPKKRDCLWRIAYYMYKDAKLWPIIYMANKDKIKDPDLIFPGQKFIIPPIPSKKKEDTTEKKDEEAIIEERTEESEEKETQGKEESPADNQGENEFDDDSDDMEIIDDTDSSDDTNKIKDSTPGKIESIDDEDVFEDVDDEDIFEEDE